MNKHALSVVLTVLAVLSSSTATSAQSSTYLILQKAESSMGFYTPAGQHLASVPVGKHPHEFVISTDGRYAYTTDNGSMLLKLRAREVTRFPLSIWSAARMPARFRLGEFRRPHGIDLDRRRVGWPLAANCRTGCS